MREHSRIGVALAASIAALAHAQSFNIDINIPAGEGAGQPSQFFGGAIGQAGTWNSINAASPSSVPLVGLNGQATPVVLHRALNGTFVSSGSPQTSGDFERLVDDVQRIEPEGQLTYTFANLEVGWYLVVTYGVNPANAANRSGVEVPGAQINELQWTGGALQGNTYLPGVTHSMQIKPITAGDSLIVRVNAANATGAASVGGFQIHKLPASKRFRMHVDAARGILGDGATWTSAMPSLQKALLQATLMGGANAEIWVRQGTFTPTAGADRFATFRIPSSLLLYGGFAGNETSLGQRTHPDFYRTTLSGEIGSPAKTDNSYNVVTMLGGSSATTIDGFTISGGYANGSGSLNKGGAIRMAPSSALVRNCRILDNTAISDGGAVYVESGQPTFSNCLFLNNLSSAGSGGAVRYDGLNGRIDFYNSSFLGNVAHLDGGALACHGRSQIGGVLFSGNKALGPTARGGAMYFAGGELYDAAIINCTVVNNLASAQTGGAYSREGADMTISNSIFWGNTDNGQGNLGNRQVFADNAENSTFQLHFCTVAGIAGADPMFIDPLGPDGVAGTLDDNLRLALNSPCIDAGDSTKLPLDVGDVNSNGDIHEQLPLDLDRRARRFDVPGVPDTGIGFPVVDRGCYETQPPFCPADFNADGQVDFFDYLDFVRAYSQGSPAADFNGDGQIDFFDYLDFIQAYSEAC